MTPLSSIATIDDLIVALLRLGYKKIYEAYKEGRIETYYEENYKNTFKVFRVPKENVVRVFINYKNEPKEDVSYGDIVIAAEVVAEFYPYIKRWYVAESFSGSHCWIDWEDCENINIEEIDKYLDFRVKKWKYEDEQWEEVDVRF